MHQQISWRIYIYTIYIYMYINSYSLNYTFQSLWFMNLNSTAMPKSRSIRRLQTHSPSCCLKAWAHGQWVIASAISSDSSEASTFQKDSCSVETWQRFPLDVETVDIDITRLCCISLKVHVWHQGSSANLTFKTLVKYKYLKRMGVQFHCVQEVSFRCFKSQRANS